MPGPQDDSMSSTSLLMRVFLRRRRILRSKGDSAGKKGKVSGEARREGNPITLFWGGKKRCRNLRREKEASEGETLEGRE